MTKKPVVNRYSYEEEKYKNAAKQRTKRTAQLIFAIAAITAMLFMLLLNQSRIVEMNFKNSKLKSEISELKVTNIQKESEIVSLLSKEDVRTRAFLLGFQEPDPGQIVYLSMPKQDRMVIEQTDKVAGADKKLSVEDTELNNYTKLEKFYRRYKQ